MNDQGSPMNDLRDIWDSAIVATSDLRMNLHHEGIALGLKADGVLPTARDNQHYGLHLRFVRALCLIPDEGAVFSRYVSRLGQAYRFTVDAIDAGFLDAELDQNTGKTIVKPSEKLKQLVMLAVPSDAEVINA